MTELPYTLEWIPGTFAIARYAPNDRIPSWALEADGFMSICRTRDELSVLARIQHVPFNAQAERGWVAFRIAGSYDLNQTGVLVRLLKPLAEAGVSVLAFSTYDTDIILLHERDKQKAVEALAAAADVSRL
jgi:uncharacterized protein